MTQAAALAKAVTVFGKNAAVKTSKCFPLGKNKAGEPTCSEYSAHERPCPTGKKVYVVGRIALGLFFEVKGTGTTWEKAFACFEANEKRDHEEYVARQKAVRP